MNQTTHIDLTGGSFPERSPVLFIKSFVVISFATRDAAEAAVMEANANGFTAIRLYDKGDKHGS